MGRGLGEQAREELGLLIGAARRGDDRRRLGVVTTRDTFLAARRSEAALFGETFRHERAS
jgi:hypothetical protein